MDRSLYKVMKNNVEPMDKRCLTWHKFSEKLPPEDETILVIIKHCWYMEVEEKLYAYIREVASWNIKDGIDLYKFKDLDKKRESTVLYWTWLPDFPSDVKELKEQEENEWSY